MSDCSNVGSLLCVVERYMLERDFGVNICSIPQVLALMLYAINNPIRHAGAIQRLGRDCSMMVYILHPAIWHSMDGIYQIIGVWDNMPTQYLKPILVAGFSIILAIAFNAIVKSYGHRIAAKNSITNEKNKVLEALKEYYSLPLQNPYQLYKSADGKDIYFPLNTP